MYTVALNTITTYNRQSMMSFLDSQMQDALLYLIPSMTLECVPGRGKAAKQPHLVLHGENTDGPNASPRSLKNSAETG